MLTPLPSTSVATLAPVIELDAPAFTLNEGRLSNGSGGGFVVRSRNSTYLSLSDLTYAAELEAI
jgi:hypothetical protein